MAIRNIVIEGDETLTKVCRPVERFDERLWELLDDMYETMASSDGIGLAAPQVGIRRRVAVVDVGEGKIELVNPEILLQEGEQNFQEGCLSCPNQWGLTTRPAKIRVRAQDRHGEYFEYDAEGILAVCSCHEIDHLDGILFKEHLVGELTREVRSAEEVEELLEEGTA